MTAPAPPTPPLEVAPARVGTLLSAAKKKEGLAPDEEDEVKFEDALGKWKSMVVRSSPYNDLHRKAKDEEELSESLRFVLSQKSEQTLRARL